MKKDFTRSIISIFYSFIGLTLLILISCGGGGGGDAPAQDTTTGIPSISNIQYSPQTATQNQGGGVVTVTGTIDFVDREGDLETLTINVYNAQGVLVNTGTAPLQNISGKTSGRIQIKQDVNTANVVDYTVDIYVTDAHGNISNKLTCTFRVTDPNLPSFIATDYYPLNVNDWIELKDDATGTVRRSSVTGVKNINGVNTKIASTEDGNIRYRTSDASGVKEYGFNSPSFMEDIIYSSPLLIAPGTGQIGTSQTSSTVWTYYYNGTIYHVDYTVTTTILGLEDVTTAQSTLKDCIKLSTKGTKTIRETGETATDTSYSWFYKGVGLVKQFTSTQSETITASYIGGILVTYVTPPPVIPPPASCTYSISPNAKEFVATSALGVVTVTPSSNSCSWTATSNASWIMITAGNAGTGTGIVSYSISTNTSTSARSGTMTIGGQTFTVTQNGAISYTIPDTGQTKCYNNYAEITCPNPGEAFYGQDGNYTINPPSYTKLGVSGEVLLDGAATCVMVQDNMTGLIWENKTSDGSIHESSKTFTWCDKNPATNGGNQGTCGTGTGNGATDTAAFIKALNDAKFGGFSDWRMPNIKELGSIVHMGRTNPAVNTGWFPNTVWSDHHMSGYYWSSTPYALNYSDAWYVKFYYGFTDSYSKSDAHAVRAVRGGQPVSLAHLVVNGNGTVTDTYTGLMWEQGTSSMTWEAALAYVEGLTLAGYEDWRLPTPKELQSIVDYSRSSPAIDTALFPGTVSSKYWSSTTDADIYVNSPGIAWYVNFSSGFVGYESGKGETFAVRAVRGR